MTTLLDVSVPVVGWIVLVVGIAFLFMAPRLLYAALIFTVPFTATTVLNFGDPHPSASSNAFGIQSAIYLGLLWMGREALSGFPSRLVAAPVAVRRSLLLLGMFLTVAVGSLAMPL